jgi:hypothetical protein
MTQMVYKSAQGKMVDMGKLMLQNENVRAVGNMNVNARGEVINDNNQPIAVQNQPVQNHYRQQIQATSSSSHKWDLD